MRPPQGKATLRPSPGRPEATVGGLSRSVMHFAETMSAPSPTPERPSSSDFVKQSSLYQEFLAEREEILRHKWLESERLGYDIGFERALLEWIRKHRESWRAARRSQIAAQSRSATPNPSISSGPVRGPSAPGRQGN